MGQAMEFLTMPADTLEDIDILGVDVQELHLLPIRQSAFLVVSKGRGSPLECTKFPIVSSATFFKSRSLPPFFRNPLLLSLAVRDMLQSPTSTLIHPR
mmetsp:Transcript_73653/g.213360  ORF Transcript_73653/g.213360 Transcript_73653/m.213360 type:complete len:98 (+) Transcript_73653:94-387(+)